MSADRAFEPPLPRCVERLDQIDPEILLLRFRDDFAQHLRLVGRGRQGALAHPAGARPADLADQDVLAGKRRGNLPPDRHHMISGQVGRNRDVLPIGKDMDGDEIDRCQQVAITQPEFPHVRIGNRDRDLPLHVADDVGERARRLFPAQKHLVADNDSADGVRILLHQLDCRCELLAIEFRVPSQPDTLKNLQPKLLGDGQYLIQTLVDRIGPDAARHRGQPAQILFNLGGVYKQ